MLVERGNQATASPFVRYRGKLFSQTCLFSDGNWPVRRPLERRFDLLLRVPPRIKFREAGPVTQVNSIVRNLQARAARVDKLEGNVAGTDAPCDFAGRLQNADADVREVESIRNGHGVRFPSVVV